MHSIYIEQLVWLVASPFAVCMRSCEGGVAIVWAYPYPALCNPPNTNTLSLFLNNICKPSQSYFILLKINVQKNKVKLNVQNYLFGKCIGYFYRPPTKLREGNVFTSMRQFAGGGYVSSDDYQLLLAGE